MKKILVTISVMAMVIFTGINGSAVNSYAGEGAHSVLPLIVDLSLDGVEFGRNGETVTYDGITYYANGGDLEVFNDDGEKWCFFTGKPSYDKPAFYSTEPDGSGERYFGDETVGDEVDVLYAFYPMMNNEMDYYSENETQICYRAEDNSFWWIIDDEMLNSYDGGGFFNTFIEYDDEDDYDYIEDDYDEEDYDYEEDDDSEDDEDDYEDYDDGDDDGGELYDEYDDEELEGDRSDDETDNVELEESDRFYDETDEYGVRESFDNYVGYEEAERPYWYPVNESRYDEPDSELVEYEYDNAVEDGMTDVIEEAANELIEDVEGNDADYESENVRSADSGNGSNTYGMYENIEEKATNNADDDMIARNANYQGGNKVPVQDVGIRKGGLDYAVQTGDHLPKKVLVSIILIIASAMGMILLRKKPEGEN